MSEGPVVNVDLMNRVLAQITNHPEGWDQGNWFAMLSEGECKTAGCFAGWAAQLSGYQPVFTDGLLWDGNSQRWYTGLKPYTEFVTDAQGNMHRVSELAEKLLGLNSDESDALFSGGNTLERLTRLVGDFTSGCSREAGYDGYDDEEYEGDGDDY